jgi:roadblock/LC7 domain-containing protein
MAKYCTNCGHELREGDKFCAECGTPVGSPASVPLRPRWETCDITYREVKPAGLFTRAQGQFVAIALGRVGSYVVAESAVFAVGANDAPDLNEPEHVAALTALISRLTADGWVALAEKVPHPMFGYLWFGHKFRRLVSS